MELKTLDGEIEIIGFPLERLKEIWSIAFGPEADLEWMKFNGPYFHDPVETWQDFSSGFGWDSVGNPHRAVIVYRGKIIGLLTAQWQDGGLQRWLEFGIVLYDASLWGKGIGKRVVPVWLDYLFDLHPEIEHIGCTTWSGNQGMMNLALKSGLKLEAQIPKVRYYQGEFFDSVKYGVLREDWRKR
ncbi:GNAT family N-acetyltransferase [Enterococcus sp. HY326]|uniref:GNAT family N-acetyltransferase n=1 Tax=Enterococcus sp. HY326 TaxID=2971265 RepID=UPI00223F8B2C|nr:GNAT family protein [Enterococcus sp. HY326]